MDAIEIRTLEDVRLKVPKEAREAFVVDLLEWLAWHDEGGGAEKMCRELEALGIRLGVVANAQALDPNLMAWVNDGKKGVSQIEVQVIKAG